MSFICRTAKVEPLSLDLFIAGSAGMLVGNVGDAIVRLERPSRSDASRTHRGRGGGSGHARGGFRPLPPPQSRGRADSGNRRAN